MAILVDSGFFIAMHSRDDPNRERAQALALQIMDGKHGQALISDYLVAEILNFFSRKKRPVEETRRIVAELVGPGPDTWLRLLQANREVFDRSIQLFDSIGALRGLSFTDCSSLVLARESKVTLIASFDAGFDGLLARLS